MSDSAGPDLPASLGSAGRYTPLRVLGRGGMGRVFLARDGKLDRLVACKVLQIYGDPQKLLELRKRFMREAEVLGRLSHPNIVQLLDFEGVGEQSMLVMEYVEGQSLEERLRRGPLPEAEVVRIAGDCADALAAAHGAGIVHRDVKPGNVLLAPDGAARLADFGLAGFLDSERVTALTRTGVMLGSLRYLPPEVLRGGGAQGEGDVYQLGLVLYEMLAGRHPRAALTGEQLMTSAAVEAIRPLEEACPDLDAWICATVNRALAEAPQERPSAAAVRDALRNGQTRLGARSGPLPQREEEPAGGVARPEERSSAAWALSVGAASDPSRVVRRKSWPGLVAALVVLLVAAAIGFSRRPGETSPAETSAAEARLELRSVRLLDLETLRVVFRGPAAGTLRLTFRCDDPAAPLPEPVSIDLGRAKPLSQTQRRVDAALSCPPTAPCVVIFEGAGTGSFTVDPAGLLSEVLGPFGRARGGREEDLLRLAYGVYQPAPSDDRSAEARLASILDAAGATSSDLDRLRSWLPKLFPPGTLVVAPICRRAALLRRLEVMLLAKTGPPLPWPAVSPRLAVSLLEPNALPEGTRLLGRVELVRQVPKPLHPGTTQPMRSCITPRQLIERAHLAGRAARFYTEFSGVGRRYALPPMDEWSDVRHYRIPVPEALARRPLRGLYLVFDGAIFCPRLFLEFTVNGRYSFHLYLWDFMRGRVKRKVLRARYGTAEVDGRFAIGLPAAVMMPGDNTVKIEALSVPGQVPLLGVEVAELALAAL